MVMEGVVRFCTEKKEGTLWFLKENSNRKAAEF
jgi:hypothetical protein